jgi:uncharacterized membrane protein HdeD (DUF308 family)
VWLNSKALKQRTAGVLLMVLGALAFSAPLVVGQWSLALLGLPLLVLSATEAYAAFRSTRHAEISAYVPSVLAMLAGNLIPKQPRTSVRAADREDDGCGGYRHLVV